MPLVSFCWLDSYWRKRYPKSYYKFALLPKESKYNGVMQVASYIMVFALYLFLSADFYGNSAAKAIKEQAPIELRFSDNERIQGQYIGKTRATLFLWEEE